MLPKVQSAVSAMLAPGEKLLVGVSGGADSVALLDALVKLGWRPHVCHLNHQLRGADSDADAEFVRQLATKYGLPVTIESRKVEPNEDAARQARFEFFTAVAQRTGILKLALAHTADDQVETFLMRLVRGAGMEGLAGIWPDRQIGVLHVIRPLLEVTRQEVLEYLRAKGLSYREDSTNRDTKFLRNRIRHELLPLLEREYNPGIRDVLRRTAEILRAEAQADPVAAERRAIRRLSFEQVEAIRQLTKRETPKPVRGRWPLNVDGETAIRELGLFFFCHSERSEEPRKFAKLATVDSEALRFAQGDKPTEERFDADALGTAPFVRTWAEGDRFQPLGMTGEKKLQDFFVDEKVPRHQRARVPLLCASDGRIAWVVGHRIADPFKITERTIRILCVRAEPIQG